MTAIRDLKAREAGLIVAAVAGTAGTAVVELAESKEGDFESTGKRSHQISYKVQSYTFEFLIYFLNFILLLIM